MALTMTYCSIRQQSQPENRVLHRYRDLVSVRRIVNASASVYRSGT